MNEKQKYPRGVAWLVALDLANALQSACERIEVVGSLRRLKPEVGDIELLYIPRRDEAKLPDEMFPQAEQNLTDLAIGTLLAAGVLEKRLNAKGNETFGEKNKLVRHVASGIPVDLFAASYENWFNYLVCRTGGMQNNIDICNAANARGWKWTPYGAGFERKGEKMIMQSEREVFEFVGLKYRKPEDRL